MTGKGLVNQAKGIWNFTSKNKILISDQ